MRVRATVVGRPLMLAGARYAIGERVGLDPSRADHREILDAGWVVLTAPASPSPVQEPTPSIPVTIALPDAPPVHKMITSENAIRKTSHKPEPRKGPRKGRA